MRRQQLKALLGQDALDEVIDQLEAQATMLHDDTLHNQLVLQRNRLHACRQHTINGTLPPEEIQRLKNQVVNALLIIIDDLEAKAPKPRRQARIRIVTGVAFIFLLAAAGYWFLQNDRPAPSSPAAEEPSARPTGTAAIRLPDDRELEFLSTGQQASFTLLDGALKPAGDGRQILTLRLRCTNGKGYPINFWDDSFRLETETGLQAPVGGLNAVVPANSSQDGTLVFEINDNTRKTELVVFSPFRKEEQRKVPLMLK